LGVKFTAVPAEWASLVSGLQADQFDLAAYLDATPARSLAIQFTDPVYTYEGVWIVKGDSGLKNTEDILAAGPIALANGTSYFPVIQALGPKDIVGTESIPDSIAAMAAGRAVAAFGDLPTLADAASKNPDLKIVVPTPALFVQDSNYGVNQDVDARSMNVLNIAIRTAQNNGTLGAAFDKAGIITIDTLGDLRMQ
jgi:ABC-type amino acid transport substrate-binding protein